ncbi:MAG: exodeoxyribonuclease VII large subunit [Deltaproteobacteria bacterium]|nr:exodeoxyribonuclease VII large subunit [Deltaproteobacteria bacterium]
MPALEKIYTVSELTGEIKGLLEEEFPFIWVEGEISNFRVPPSGHFYFSLKDAGSQVRAVFFRSGQGGLGFVPEDGLQVLCLGRVSVYSARGEYQLILERMELKGWGALQLAFERLKERLQQEGLFEAARKKKLPVLPRKVAVVTSPSGAAIRDFLRILYRRFRNIQVCVFPVLVQGEGASREIAETLTGINRANLGIEVIVLTRGGGSIEDLWAFNEERVARAIAASAIPVISAVGHEVDFTIADFVADLRASTPSAAAELLIRSQAEWAGELEAFQKDLRQALARKLERLNEKTDHLRRRLGDPRRRWVEMSLRLDDAAARLRSALNNNLGQKAHRLGVAGERLWGLNPRERLAGHSARLAALRIQLQDRIQNRFHHRELDLERLSQTLQALSPWAVLARGYALARTLPELTVIKEARQVSPGSALRLQLSRGALDCRVEEIWKEEDS